MTTVWSVPSRKGGHSFRVWREKQGETLAASRPARSATIPMVPILANSAVAIAECHVIVASSNRSQTLVKPHVYQQVRASGGDGERDCDLAVCDLA